VFLKGQKHSTSRLGAYGNSQPHAAVLDAPATAFTKRDQNVLHALLFCLIFIRALSSIRAGFYSPQVRRLYYFIKSLMTSLLEGCA
jgi:hypothetical protein